MLFFIYEPWFKSSFVKCGFNGFTTLVVIKFGCIVFFNLKQTMVLSVAKTELAKSVA